MEQKPVVSRAIDAMLRNEKSPHYVIGILEHLLITNEIKKSDLEILEDYVVEHTEQAEAKGL